MTSYEYNKKYILKYQKENPYYRTYRRKYEAKYRAENRLKLNYTSWSCINKEATAIERMDYLLHRFLKDKGVY